MRTLKKICSDVGVKIIPNYVSRSAGETKCCRTLQRLLSSHGEGHLILLLRTFMETSGNDRALVEPVIWAVSDVMLANPHWPAQGLAWLEAFDQIDLCEIWAWAKSANGAPPERHAIAYKLVELLKERFGDGLQRLAA